MPSAPPPPPPPPPLTTTGTISVAILAMSTTTAVPDSSPILGVPVRVRQHRTIEMELDTVVTGKRPREDPYTPPPSLPVRQRSSPGSFAEALIQEHAKLLQQATPPHATVRAVSSGATAAATTSTADAAAADAAAASLRCPICQDTPQDPQVSLCGHVCCSECWKKALGVKLECPVCRQKVREKQLKRIYL